MPSPDLVRRLWIKRNQVKARGRRTNRTPMAIVGAEHHRRKGVDHSGSCPTDLAPKLQRELTRKLGRPGTKHNGNYIGCCCEVRASHLVLRRDKRIDIDDIEFTDVLIVRTGGRMQRCPNCQIIFG